MIWFNGQLTGGGRLDATAAGALLGWGVFSTLAIRGGSPIFWARHAARLERDAGVARVDLTFGAAQLRAGVDELVGALGIGEGLARITGTRRGDGRWNLESGADWSIVAQVAPSTAASDEPLRLMVSPSRVAANAPLAGVKTTSYLPYLWAWQNARDAGFDEALLLTEGGLVCEAARASVFWLDAGKWRTPALDCGCLRGVGREVVLEISGAREGPLPVGIAARRRRSLGGFGRDGRARDRRGLGQNRAPNLASAGATNPPSGKGARCPGRSRSKDRFSK